MNRKTGVILSYVLMIFEVLSTLLLTPFIIRSLGQAEYGVYRLSASINAYLLLLDLGVGNAIIRFIAKYRVEKNKKMERQFLGVAISYYSIIALIAIIGGCILISIFPTAFAKGLNSNEIALGQRLLGITMLNTAVTLGTATFNNVLIAYERFAISRGASIVQIILRMLLTYIVVRMGMGSVGIVTVNLCMTIICRSFFVAYVLWCIKLKPMFRGIRIAFIKEIIAYSSLILLQMVATQINATVDQILIGALVDAAAVVIAVYGVGTQIVQYFQSLGSSFNGVLMPGIVRLVENGGTAERICDEMVRIGRIIFMLLGLIWTCFLLYGKQFVILWAGEKNTDAYYVSAILMTAYLFILTESIGTQVLWAKNQHKEQSILKLVIVVVNILLTVALIKWNPLLGATIGTFISLMLGDVVVMNWVFVKKIGISLKRYYGSLLKGIVPCLIITGIVGQAIKIIRFDSWLWLGGHIIVVCLCYVGLLWIIGLNRYEKDLIKKMIFRKREKKA